MSDSKAKLVTANQEVVVERRKVSFVIAIAIVIVTVIVVVIVLVTKGQFLIVIVINCIIRCLRNIALVALLYIVNIITDMEFVQNFTPPDFQAKNFTPSIPPNFNSFSKKKHKK